MAGRIIFREIRLDFHNESGNARAVLLVIENTPEQGSRKVNRALRKEPTRQHVLQQTGSKSPAHEPSWLLPAPRIVSAMIVVGSVMIMHGRRRTVRGNNVILSFDDNGRGGHIPAADGRGLHGADYRFADSLIMEGDHIVDGGPLLDAMELNVIDDHRITQSISRHNHDI